MPSTSIPCKNPKICGVQNHRPGTLADCMKPGNHRNQAARGPGSIAATPQLLTKSGYPTGTWSPEVQGFAEEWEWSEDTKSRDIRVADNNYAEPELYEVTTADQVQPGDLVILVDPNQSYGDAVERIKHHGPDSSSNSNALSQLAPLRWRNVVDRTEDGALVIQRMDESGESWPYRPDLVPTEGMKIIRSVREDTGEPNKWDEYKQYGENPDLIEELATAKSKDTETFRLASKAIGAMKRVKINMSADAVKDAEEIDPGVYLITDKNDRKALVFDNAQVTTKTRTTGYLQRDTRKDAPFEFINGLWQGEGNTDDQPDMSHGDFGDGHKWVTPYLSDGPRQAVKDKYGHLI